jgi:hypothetical protein
VIVCCLLKPSRYGRQILLKSSLRSRTPVAIRTALATAGAIGGTPGSPTPVGDFTGRHYAHLYHPWHLVDSQHLVLITMQRGRQTLSVTSPSATE